MRGGRLLRACLATLALLAAAAATRPAQAQANFDRPGGDYLSSPVPSGDPADCALACERDRRCRAWSFNYPTDVAGGAVCWLKSSVPARVPDNCCVSGVRGAGVVEPRNPADRNLDRPGRRRLPQLRRSRAATATRPARRPAPPTTNAGPGPMRAPGYVGKEAHCFLKKEIKPPRRKAGFISGVVR